MSTGQWWYVTCSAGCRWSSTRRGTEDQVKRHGCGRCSADVNAMPSTAPGGGQTLVVPGA